MGHGKYCWGSFQDWLILVNNQYLSIEISLVNPFTGSKINLPSTWDFYHKIVLLGLPSQEKFFFACLYTINTGRLPDFWLWLVCAHPDGEQIKTNQQNILIRSLTLKSKKGDSSSKDVKSAGVTESSRKRYCYCFKLAYICIFIKI